MTLLEVLLTLAIFLVGSVGIMGLFVAASVLHKDAVDRRTAAYIGATLLAHVEAQPLHEVFAKTTIQGTPSPNTLPVAATSAAFALSPIANFGPSAPPAPIPFEFPILVNSEQHWVTDITTTTSFTLQGSTSQAAPAPVLQPLTWGFVLNAGINAQSTSLAVNEATFEANANPPIPATGYIVIDKEWIKYSQFTPGSPATFTVDPAVPNARGWGLTAATAHNAGTPVTVAQEYPGYPGFYYTVQFYPVNATGAEAHVIVTVGYGPTTRFRVVEFEGIYTPSQY